jgi:hypothetical protein
MNINVLSPLFLTDLYFYDIRSCYYEIAKSAYYDLEGIDKDDKTKRNIALGMKQVDNENFQKYLQESADSIIDYYLFENGVEPEEIIVRQRDGFILTRLLDDNKSMMKIEFREHIHYMIITLDRKKFLTTSDQGVTIKGMPNNYPGIEKVYNMFSKLNIYNKKGLFRQLDKIKNYVLTSDDIDLYIIEKNNKRLLITERMGVVELKTGNYITKGIDRKKYYNLYIKEFVNSLILNFW